MSYFSKKHQKQHLTNYSELCEAIKRRDTKAALRLLEHSSTVNPKHGTISNSPLHWSIIKFNGLEIINNLIGRRANIYAKNQYGETPLSLAVKFGRVSVVEILLKMKAHLREHLDPLVYDAIKKGRQEIVDLLVNYGVKDDPSINLKNSLVEAVQRGDFKLVKRIIPYCNYEHLSEKEIPRNMVFKTAQEFKQCVDILVQYGFSILHGSEKCSKFVHSAVRNEHITIVKELVKCGINVNMVNDLGLTLLHVACLNKNFELVKILIEHGADVNSSVIDRFSHFKETPLHIAAVQGQKEIIQILLENGANINSLNVNNQSAYELAFKKFLDFKQSLGWGDYNVLGYGWRVPEIYQVSHRGVVAIHEDIADMLKERIIKLKCAGLNVNGRDFDLIYGGVGAAEGSFDDKYSNKFQKHTLDFGSACEEEVRLLKAEEIGESNITFYDLLSQKIQDIVGYVRNQSVVQSLKSDIHNQKFPLYIGIIKNRFAEGLKRSKLLEIAQKYSHPSIFVGLPHVCLDKMYSYLNCEELKTLIKSINPRINFEE